MSSQRLTLLSTADIKQQMALEAMATERNGLKMEVPGVALVPDRISPGGGLASGDGQQYRELVLPVFSRSLVIYYCCFK